MKCDNPKCKKKRVVPTRVYITKDGTEWFPPRGSWHLWIRNGVPIFVCSERCAEEYIETTFGDRPVDGTKRGAAKAKRARRVGNAE